MLGGQEIALLGVAGTGDPRLWGGGSPGQKEPHWRSWGAGSSPVAPSALEPTPKSHPMPRRREWGPAGGGAGLSSMLVNG